METNQIIKINISLRVILITMTIGIWILVLQNTGIIPTKQNVYVKGGYIDVDGKVNVEGSVSVNNTVDINIEKILGRKAGTRPSYIIDGVQYNSLDVTAR